MKQSLKSYTAWILVTLAVGGLGSILVQKGMAYYKLLSKPSFTPPDILFPIAWTILYVLMGIGMARIRLQCSAEKSAAATKSYLFQLALNFLWNLWFFTLHWFAFAFFWLLGLIAAIVHLIVQFRRLDVLSAHLQIPYLLWSCFAAVLNLGIYWLN